MNITNSKFNRRKQTISFLKWAKKNKKSDLLHSKDSKHCADIQMWCSHTNGALFRKKRSKLLVHMKTWQNLIIIMLSERSQSHKKSTQCYFHLYKLLGSANLPVLTESRPVAAHGTCSRYELRGTLGCNYRMPSTGVWLTSGKSFREMRGFWPTFPLMFCLEFMNSMSSSFVHFSPRTGFLELTAKKIDVLASNLPLQTTCFLTSVYITGQVFTGVRVTLLFWALRFKCFSQSKICENERIDWKE